MFGYVVVDKSIIKQEEFVLYSAFYCGLCVTIGNRFGQILRYTTNYDIAFFAALIFDRLNADVEFVQTKCIGNPFVNKPIIKQNELLNRIADINIIFSYYKLLDNLVDGKRGAKTALRLLKKHYERAAQREPRAAQICCDAHQMQQQIEARMEQSIDIAADCFARQLREIGALLIGNDDESTLGLCYNVGKFVYLADALDDIDEDFRANTYNPFLASNGNKFKNRRDFIAENRQQISFALNSTVNRAIESFNGIKFNQSYGLIENIVYYGLRNKAAELLDSTKKLKRPRF